MAAAQAPGVPVLDFSFNADGNCSSSAGGPHVRGSYQYCAVKATANALAISPSSSAGQRIIGILQNDPPANEGATVRLLGISKCVVDGAAGAITPGDWLASDASARGVKTTSANAEVFGFALQGSTAQNDIISIVILPALRY